VILPAGTGALSESQSNFRWRALIADFRAIPLNQNLHALKANARSTWRSEKSAITPKGTILQPH
jgi:hypothetical protein